MGKQAYSKDNNESLNIVFNNLYLSLGKWLRELSYILQRQGEFDR